MPYFKWSGVDILGVWHKGRLFAPSITHLDNLLLQRGIALLKSQPSKLSFFTRAISLQDTIQIFRQLAVLLDAGVLLPQALSLVADQINNPRLQEVIHTLADHVHAGIALSTVMQNYPTIFTIDMIQHVKVGEESGELVLALDALTTSLEMTHDFYTQLRSVLLLPLITLGFFVCIAGIIFTMIIPRFADFFASTQQEIPQLTKMLLRMSMFMRSWYMVCSIILLFGLFMLMRWYTKRDAGKYKLLALCMKIPGIKTIFIYRFLASFLHGLAMLLKGGMRLVPALHVVQSSTEGQLFAKQVTFVEQAVEGGSSLSNALVQVPNGLFGQDIIAMVMVGEESGQLANMLDRVAQVYHQKVKQQLAATTVLLQPLFMLLLGLLVTILIFAVYGPIFNLANAVGF